MKGLEEHETIATKTSYDSSVNIITDAYFKDRAVKTKKGYISVTPFLAPPLGLEPRTL